MPQHKFHGSLYTLIESVIIHINALQLNHRTLDQVVWCGIEVVNHEGRATESSSHSTWIHFLRIHVSFVNSVIQQEQTSIYDACMELVHSFSYYVASRPPKVIFQDTHMWPDLGV